MFPPTFSLWTRDLITLLLLLLFCLLFEQMKLTLLWLFVSCHLWRHYYLLNLPNVSHWPVSFYDVVVRRSITLSQKCCLRPTKRFIKSLCCLHSPQLFPVSSQQRTRSVFPLWIAANHSAAGSLMFTLSRVQYDCLDVHYVTDSIDFMVTSLCFL